MLKKEVGIAVCKLRLQADDVKFKIRAAVRRSEGDDGLLTHEEGNYFDCIDIDQDKLDKLLSKDEDHWRVNLREARDTLATYKSNLQALLLRQTAEIESMLQMDTSDRKYSLRKLALWGEQVSTEEINFEWPDASSDIIWPSVQLHTLEMKSFACVLSSIRCVLSNGISSPVFERNGINH